MLLILILYCVLLFILCLTTGDAFTFICVLLISLILFFCTVSYWYVLQLEMHIRLICAIKCYLLTYFSKIQIGLPFWYRLTWVVPEKGPLNGYVCMRVCLALSFDSIFNFFDWSGPVRVLVPLTTPLLQHFYLPVWLRCIYGNTCEQHPLISRLQLDCQSWLKFFGMLSPLS